MIQPTMNKQTIFTILFILAAVAGQGQTKTATVTGYSPALKDGTLVLAAVGNIGNCCRHRTSRAFCLHTTC